MAYESVPFSQFASTFGTQTEISSVALGGKIVDVSDEFFAQAENLLKVEPAPSLKGQFGPNGALYSGWESRRHNPAYDWCIIKFGAVGLISGFDIDTSHFNGNEAPEASVQALFDISDTLPTAHDPRWTEILPKVSLGPSSRHLFKTDRCTDAYNYVKLNMYPDGGIARFRAYGLIRAVFSEGSEESIDLAHVFSGGRAVFVSDQHFGVGSNLLLPGRGKDMGDGWETKRSRTKGNKDWVIIKLGEPGYLEKAEIDTAHFKGNFPESCGLHALNSPEITPVADESAWTCILPRTKLGAHAQHYFDLENVHGKVYSHVRVTIYPDGGIKRVRIIGKRAIEGEEWEDVDRTASEDQIQETESEDPELVKVKKLRYKLQRAFLGKKIPTEEDMPGLNELFKETENMDVTLEMLKVSKIGEVMRHISVLDPERVPRDSEFNFRGRAHELVCKWHRSISKQSYSTMVTTAVPLSPEAFSPFGDVVQAFSSASAAPSGTKVTLANQGSALKFHKLAPIVSSYPPPPPPYSATSLLRSSRGLPTASPGLSVYRCSPLNFDFRRDHDEAGPGWEVCLLERHPYTNQAFIPMGVGGGEALNGSDALEKPGRAYLVVVARNGEDDKPDLRTMRAFLAGAGQSVVYATGIWHHPMVALDTTMDFTCVETQIGDGSTADCEIVELDKTKGYPRVKIALF